MKIKFFYLIGFIALFLASTLACAESTSNSSERNHRELLVYLGGGKQLHTNSQRNTASGVDLHLYRFDFTANQTLFIGTGITQLTSNTNDHKKLVAFSIYPQLNLALPDLGASKPYFYVRTLGPTYLSETQLGERKQGNHFAFQSQIGVGLYFGGRHQWTTNLGYRHYSNAGLSSPNDGIDATFLFTFGGKF